MKHIRTYTRPGSAVIKDSGDDTPPPAITGLLTVLESFFDFFLVLVRFKAGVTETTSS